MKKIGFIDYFLDEWHANNYPVWIADPRHGGQFVVAYAWAAMDKPDGLTTGEWCAKFGVAQASSQEELIEKCDCIVVLSPDNPEQHEALAALALKSGKPVYVDKTFATNRAAAERMFNLAQKYATPMYSTSALRYTSEFAWLRDNDVVQADVEFASARGPGVFENYAIHQLEMIVSAMGTGAKRAIAHGTDNAPVVVFEYENGRSSVVNHLPWSGFSLAVQDNCGKGAQLAVVENFWEGFVDALLKFFETGVHAVPRAETCEAIAMYEAGVKALLKPGTWVDVPKA
jgi:predicted dehydrogenase